MVGVAVVVNAAMDTLAAKPLQSKLREVRKRGGSSWLELHIPANSLRVGFFLMQGNFTAMDLIGTNNLVAVSIVHQRNLQVEDFLRALHF